MNPAFRNVLVTARRTAQQTALEHAKLSEMKVSQAIECVRLGQTAQLVPKGSKGYATQQHVITTQFDIVNKSVTEVRDFITAARKGQVGTDNMSLVSMRLHLQTIQNHMKTLHMLSNK